MRTMTKILTLFFLMAMIVSCVDKKKEHDEVQRAVKEIEAIEEGIDKAAEEVEKKAEELEKTIEELDNI